MASANGTNGQRPNILFIMSDQHRADCLGAYGNKEIQTPNIDRLAADGVTYEQSFCSAPLCTPSRYSTLTGLYPHQHLGWSNVCSIQPGLATYPRLLKAAGYRTKAVGKMHLTPTYQDVGFAEMLLAEQNGNGRFEDDYHRDLQQLGLIDRVDLLDQVNAYRKTAPQDYWDSCGTMESNLAEEHHSTAWIGRHALETLEEWEQGGNLLFVSFIKPHHPFDPPAPWSTMYDPQTLTLLPGYTEQCSARDLAMHPGFFPHEQWSEDQLRKSMAYYYGTISHIDDYIGRMIRLLEQKGLYDNTLIIYTSDHGEYLGFHHLLLKQNYMYDPLVKVPLIIKRHDSNHKGMRSSELVSNIDLAVTLARVAGIEPGKEMGGMDLIACADREVEHAAALPHKALIPREYVFAEEKRGHQYMIRSKTYKLILCKDREKSLLFDLVKDPYEWNNLFVEPAYAELIGEMSAALHQLVLFDATAPVFLDEAAPLIQQPNVPSDQEERKAAEVWIGEKMREL